MNAKQVPISCFRQHGVKELPHINEWRGKRLFKPVKDAIAGPRAKDADSVSVLVKLGKLCEDTSSANDIWDMCETQHCLACQRQFDNLNLFAEWRISSGRVF